MPDYTVFVKVYKQSEKRPRKGHFGLVHVNARNAKGVRKEACKRVRAFGDVARIKVTGVQLSLAIKHL